MRGINIINKHTTTMEKTISKKQLHFTEHMPGVALEYIPIDVNRANRRAFLSYHKVVKNTEQGAVSVEYWHERRKKRLTARTRYRTGQITNTEQGRIQLGEATAEVVAEDPQTIFVVFCWKYKKVGFWSHAWRGLVKLGVLVVLKVGNTAVKAWNWLSLMKPIKFKPLK